MPRRQGSRAKEQRYDGIFGFHATATVGSSALLAACAHLLRLDAEQFSTALGYCRHPGGRIEIHVRDHVQTLARRQSVLSWTAVKSSGCAGFTSRLDVIECQQGFVSTHSPDFHPERAADTPAHGWYIRSNLFKYHAACYMVHSSIEATRKLREQFGVTPDRVEHVSVELEESCDRICNIPAPRTGLEAKFSLRLATAMGLAGIDTGRLSNYSEAVAADPELVRLVLG